MFSMVQVSDRLFQQCLTATAISSIVNTADKASKGYPSITTHTLIELHSGAECCCAKDHRA